MSAKQIVSKRNIIKLSVKMIYFLPMIKLRIPTEIMERNQSSAD